MGGSCPHIHKCARSLRLTSLEKNGFHWVSSLSNVLVSSSVLSGCLAGWWVRAHPEPRQSPPPPPHPSPPPSVWLIFHRRHDSQDVVKPRWLSPALALHLFARRPSVCVKKRRSWSSQAAAIADRSVTEPQWLPDGSRQGLNHLSIRPLHPKKHPPLPWGMSLTPSPSNTRALSLSSSLSFFPHTMIYTLLPITSNTSLNASSHRAGISNVIQSLIYGPFYRIPLPVFTVYCSWEIV